MSIFLLCQSFLKKTKELLKAEVVQDMMAIVLDSDLDGDFHITEEETDILILRLSVVEGVERINRRKMKEVLEQKGGSLPAIFDVIKNIMDDSQIMSEYDRIVTFDQLTRKPKKEASAVPSFAAASSDSDATLWE
jgi:DNA polymerase elongation subunit (family B)